MSDWDLPRCYTYTTPKARKKHNCYECFHVIQPGEKYHRLSGIWPDGAMTHVTCQECHDIADIVAPDGYAFGSLIDHADYCYDESSDTPDMKLVVGWVDRWNAASAEIRRSKMAEKAKEDQS